MKLFLIALLLFVLFWTILIAVSKIMNMIERTRKYLDKDPTNDIEYNEISLMDDFLAATFTFASAGVIYLIVNIWNM